MSILSGIGGRSPLTPAVPTAAPTPPAMATPPGTIGGDLPFGAGGGALGGALGGSLGDSYAKAYNSALAQNQAMYKNILQGYQQTAGQQYTAQQAIAAGYPQLAENIQRMQNTAMGQQQAAQQTIGGGYNQLQNNVLGTIQGIGKSQSQAIADVYGQQSGALAQQLVNRGLGNTTVQGSMQRGLDLDQQKAQIALANQLAQLSAGYQSQLGLSGLNYQNQAAMQNSAQQNMMAQTQAGLGEAGLNYANLANMQNTGQANQQLGWMNTVNMKYPDAGAYMQMQAAQGALQQQQDFMNKFPMTSPQAGMGMSGFVGPHVNSGMGGQMGQGSPAQLGGYGGPMRPTGANQPYTGQGGYVNTGASPGGMMDMSQLGSGLYNLGQQASQYAAGLGGRQYGPPESLMNQEGADNFWPWTMGGQAPPDLGGLNSIGGFEGY